MERQTNLSIQEHFIYLHTHTHCIYASDIKRKTTWLYPNWCKYIHCSMNKLYMDVVKILKGLFGDYWQYYHVTLLFPGRSEEQRQKEVGNGFLGVSCHIPPAPYWHANYPREIIFLYPYSCLERRMWIHRHYFHHLLKTWIKYLKIIFLQSIFLTCNSHAKSIVLSWSPIKQ